MKFRGLNSESSTRRAVVAKKGFVNAIIIAKRSKENWRNDNKYKRISISVSMKFKMYVYTIYYII